MAESGVTIRSDSEQYSAGEDISTSPPSSNSPPLVLYQPPTLFGIIRGAAINLFLPFINGMMLGFGELFAHEAAFRLGWSGTRVCRWILKNLMCLLEPPQLTGYSSRRSSPSRGGKPTPPVPASKCVTGPRHSPTWTTSPAWSD